MQQNQICFRTLGQSEPWTIKTYESAGGYKIWRKILKEKTHRKNQNLSTSQLRRANNF